MIVLGGFPGDSDEALSVRANTGDMCLILEIADDSLRDRLGVRPMDSPVLVVIVNGSVGWVYDHEVSALEEL